MQFNSVKRQNFSSLAKSTNRTMDQVFAAGRESAVNHTKIAKESIKGRGLERRAAMKAEADVAIAGLNAKTELKIQKMKGETEKAVADIKRPAKRMAGIVGGLGAIAGGYVTMQENKKDKAERDELRTYRNQLDAKADARDAERAKRDAEILKALQKRGNGGNEPSDPKPSSPEPAGSAETPAPTPSPTAAAPTPAPAPTPTSSSKGSSTKITPSASTGTMTSQFKKIYDLAVKDGRSKFPEIVAAQAMHETGHLQNPKSVYFQSGKTNPFGQTGDRGYGTMTRNGDSNGWSKFPDLQTAVSDHITLWHDTGNHSENYNAYSTASEGLSKVIPAYSPNSDPANKAGGYTESAYSASVKKILRDNGFDIK